MTFIVVGGGRVGMRTARLLREEGYDVVVVERGRERVDRLREEGFETVHGDGSDADVLDEAGLGDAVGVAGLTGDLNVNYAACMLGAAHDARTVLRIDEDYRREIYDRYAEQVDDIINPEQLGAVGAKNALLGGDVNVLTELTEDLELLTVRIPEGSPVVGTSVTELGDHIDEADARVYAHGRPDEVLEIPIPGTRIRAGDRIAVVAEPDAVAAVRTKLIGPDADASTGRA